MKAYVCLILDVSYVIKGDVGLENCFATLMLFMLFTRRAESPTWAPSDCTQYVCVQSQNSLVLVPKGLLVAVQKTHFVIY